MGRKVIVELPDTPVTDAFNDDPRKGLIDQFLSWLGGSKYKVSEEDRWGSAEDVELQYDFIRRDMIAEFLGIDPEDMRKERNSIEEIMKHATTGAIL